MYADVCRLTFLKSFYWIIWRYLVNDNKKWQTPAILQEKKESSLSCSLLPLYTCLLFNCHTQYEFRFSDLYHVILGCDETTALTSLSWRSSRGVNSTHHCHYTMASADSKFDDLSNADTDSLIDDAIPKNTKKATPWGISVLKASWGVFACCQQFCQLCAVYSIWIIKMFTHSLLVNHRDLPVLSLVWWLFIES